MARKYVRQKGSKTPGRPKTPVIPVSKGLPPKEINLDQVLYWIGIQATAQEIASSFYVSVDALDACLKEHFNCNFTELKEKVQGTGKLSLRRYQFKQAEKNCSMAIWLGKQWLGQKDHDDKKELPSNDANLNLILELIKENKTLKDRLDAIESKATPIIQSGDETV